ncbi:unnamed protein product [Eruca vesicaria subsp. sativa]|uniref:RNA polymerase sigma-70 region 1.2 domain-containing protein n=1 Tax=Eruca vesicaria subsp. sativa TaxID=29727 RepID=A0ABC8J5X2_ERUVS|nr:unnamed protein product [Eruca vesicaria subsp. sativa]
MLPSPFFFELPFDSNFHLLLIYQHLIKLEKVKTKLESQNGCEPTIAEWAEALGLSGPVLKSEIHCGRSSSEKLITANLRLVVHIAKQYQNRGLNFQNLFQVSSQTNTLLPSKQRRTHKPRWCLNREA